MLPLYAFLAACTPASPSTDSAETAEADTDTDTDTDTDADTDTDTSDCAEELDGLYEVTEGAGAPYFVSSPKGKGDAPTILYLPGGGGGQTSARSGLLGFFGSTPSFIERYRVLAPYSESDSFPNEYRRALEVVSEAQRCWGVGPVHLVGHSAGGNAAAALMAEDAAPWRSFAVAPGSFSSSVTSSDLADIFAEHDAYLGVGEHDDGWREYTEALAEALEDAGVSVTLDVWEGQGHVPDGGFDPTVLHGFLDAR